TYSFFGPDLHQQFYAVSNRRFELVRLEDSQGKVLPICRQGFGVGPETTPPTKEEWLGWLTSFDRLDCLRALATKPAVSIKKLMDPTTKTRLIELSKSSDRWIAESATAFLKVVENPQDVDDQIPESDFSQI